MGKSERTVTSRGLAGQRLWVFRSLSFAFVVLLAPATVRAQLGDGLIDIHGFGGWEYGITNANQYLAGTPTGNYETAEFSLNVSARLPQNVTVIAQVAWDDNAQGSVASLDYAFAQWRATDWLAFRAGVIKQPFGIYTELFDVGTIRPFLFLPQAVYGPAGFVSVAFKGIGVQGSRPIPAGWRIGYDLYAGAIDVPEDNAGFDVLTHDTTDAHGVEIEPTENVVGGRVRLVAPWGFDAGVSAFTGRGSEGSTAYADYIVGAHAEYVSDRWWIRSEYAHETEAGQKGSTGWYLEPAYFLTRHWQAALQYDRSWTTLVASNAAAAPSLLSHEELAVGLNYYITTGFVLKLSSHWVTGNRFAHPPDDDLAAIVDANGLQRNTRLLQIGTDFSF